MSGSTNMDSRLIGIIGMAMRVLLICPLYGFLVICPAATSPAPDSFIWLDVSIKVIVDPVTGNVPTTMSDALLLGTFEDMNRWLANNWRGYRVRAVDLDASRNFRRLGGLDDTTGPGKWYATNLKDDSNHRMFEIEAKGSKQLYAWNDSAINIYFNNGDYSSCGFPLQKRDLVQSAYGLFTDDRLPGQMFTQRYKAAGNLLHEIGHFFELYHTFDGDDGIADTARDPNEPRRRNETAVRDAIATLNFSKNYSALSSFQKTLVDNTANNPMSYTQLFYDDPAQNKVLTDAERFGPVRFQFTEQQMDKWADFANDARASVASGRMIFVLRGSGFPSTLAAGLNAARSSGHDIVLLRPGNYNERLTITKPVTLRATRQGTVTIGRP